VPNFNRVPYPPQAKDWSSIRTYWIYKIKKIFSN